MESKNDVSEDLVKRVNANLSLQSATSEEELEQSEVDSDSEWETQSENEWDIPSESEWSFGGDTVSGSDSGDEKLMPLCSITTPSLLEWTHELHSANVCAFKLKPGLKETCGKSPVDFFKLLFKRSLFEFLVNNINNYAIKVVNQNQPGRRYKEVTVTEFQVFFGLFLNFEFCGTEPLVEHLKEYMTEARFGAILKFLNFEYNMPGNSDKMYKISHMINYFNITMKKAVNPEKILCIEKSFTAPCRENLYLLIDQFGLVHKLFLCAVKEKAGPRVAKCLLDDKLDVGHSIYMDETFNSLELTKFLVDRNTHVTGPIKRKRLGNLKKATSKQLGKGEKLVKYNSDGICITKWNRLGTVTISTEHSGEWREVYSERHKEMRRKPACVVEYKKITEGMENHVELLGDYYIECGDRTDKYKKIGVHILQMLLLNAYLLYDRYGEDSGNNDLLDFRTAIIKHLLSHGKPLRV